MSAINILVVEDNPDDAALIAESLDEFTEATLSVASTAKQALEKINQHFDLYLLDLRLPDADGTQLLERMRRRGFRSWTRAVVLSGNSDENVSRQVVRNFGLPFLDKTHLKPGLADWVEGLVSQPLDHWSNDLWMALGASLWGAGQCGFLVVNGRLDPLALRDGQRVTRFSEGLQVVCMPNASLTAVKQAAEALENNGHEGVRQVYITDMSDRSDWGRLIKELIVEFRVGDKKQIIWPQA